MSGAGAVGGEAFELDEAVDVLEVGDRIAGVDQVLGAVFGLKWQVLAGGKVAVLVGAELFAVLAEFVGGGAGDFEGFVGAMLGGGFLGNCVFLEVDFWGSGLKGWWGRYADHIVGDDYGGDAYGAGEGFAVVGEGLHGFTGVGLDFTFGSGATFTVTMEDGGGCPEGGTTHVGAQVLEGSLFVPALPFVDAEVLFERGFLLGGEFAGGDVVPAAGVFGFAFGICPVVAFSVDE